MISLRDNTDPNSGDSKAGVVTIQILRGAFEGMTGHQPRSDQELNEWLATDEGKEATIFEATALSTWGDKARS